MTTSIKPTADMTQGIDPAKAFDDNAATLFAVSGAVDGGYSRMSEHCAAFAVAHMDGLAGKDVLDIGCGYGATTMALTVHAPKSIIAVDNSKAMIELLRTILLSDKDLARWLSSIGAPAVLGDFHEPLLDHLEGFRMWFNRGIFNRRGGTLEAHVCDGLELGSLGLRPVDLVIGNNYFHWPINQRRAALEKEHTDWSAEKVLEQACSDALEPLADVLKPGGTMVLMEPIDFITLEDEVVYRDLMDAYLTSHPLFVRFHETFNRILKDEHDIDRNMPKASPLFHEETMPDMFAANGFELVQLHTVEWAYTCPPLDVFLVRLPMTIAKVDIPFEKKIELGKRVRAELLKANLSDKELAFTRNVWFFSVLKKI